MGKVKGRVKLTPVEIEERENFIITRIRSGFSKMEIQKQFAAYYKLTNKSASIWYNNACDKLAPSGFDDRKRTRAAIIELYHSQITAYQGDIIASQQEINYFDEVLTRKKNLIEMLLSNEPENKDLEEDIIKELKYLPDIKFETKLNSIEIKTRIRERMFRVMCDLSRIQGLYNTENNWVNALNVLIDNNLLPIKIAEIILKKVESLKNVDSLEEELNQFNNIIKSDEIEKNKKNTGSSKSKRVKKEEETDEETDEEETDYEMLNDE